MMTQGGYYCKNLTTGQDQLIYFRRNHGCQLCKTESTIQESTTKRTTSTGLMGALKKEGKQEKDAE